MGQCSGGASPFSPKNNEASHKEMIDRKKSRKVNRNKPIKAIVMSNIQGVAIASMYEARVNLNTNLQRFMEKFVAPIIFVRFEKGNVVPAYITEWTDKASENRPPDIGQTIYVRRMKAISDFEVIGPLHTKK